MKIASSLTNFLVRQSRYGLLAEAIALVIAIGIIDYVTGYEVTIFVFYCIPIFLAVWFIDRNSGILIALLSGLAWLWSDTASGHHYSREWLRAWDTVARLMYFFSIIIWAIAWKQQRDTNQARIALLERSHRLEQEIISISEQEQQRIGRDLHDGICQQLAALGIAAASLKDDLDHERSSRADAAGRIAGLLKQAVAQTRDLSRGLSPVDRDAGGLLLALEELASNTSRLLAISCSVIADESIPIHHNIIATHLFRIAQEAINNAVKHGRAKNILIAMETSEGDFSMRISDDGVGFDSERIGNNGMGLSIMRYRARAIDATLEVQPNIPTGTVVACTIRGVLHSNPSAPADKS